MVRGYYENKRESYSNTVGYYNYSDYYADFKIRK